MITSNEGRKNRHYLGDARPSASCGARGACGAELSPGEIDPASADAKEPPNPETNQESDASAEGADEERSAAPDDSGKSGCQRYADRPTGEHPGIPAATPESGHEAQKGEDGKRELRERLRDLTRGLGLWELVDPLADPLPSHREQKHTDDNEER